MTPYGSLYDVATEGYATMINCIKSNDINGTSCRIIGNNLGPFSIKSHNDQLWLTIDLSKFYLEIYGEINPSNPLPQINLNGVLDFMNRALSDKLNCTNSPVNDVNVLEEINRWRHAMNITLTSTPPNIAGDTYAEPGVVGDSCVGDQLSPVDNDVTYLANQIVLSNTNALQNSFSNFDKRKRDNYPRNSTADMHHALSARLSYRFA